MFSESASRGADGRSLLQFDLGVKNAIPSERPDQPLTILIFRCVESFAHTQGRIVRLRTSVVRSLRNTYALVGAATTKEIFSDRCITYHGTLAIELDCHIQVPLTPWRKLKRRIREDTCLEASVVLPVRGYIPILWPRIRRCIGALHRVCPRDTRSSNERRMRGYRNPVYRRILFGSDLHCFNDCAGVQRWLGDHRPSRSWHFYGVSSRR